MRERLLFAGAAFLVVTGADGAWAASTRAPPDPPHGSEPAPQPQAEHILLAQLLIGQELAADPTSPSPRGGAALAPHRQGLITRYEASDLARFNASTALDLVRQMPGFTLEEGDTVRGLAGAYGNVLINGRPPNSKAESLKNHLARIPAEQVRAVELMDTFESYVLASRQGLIANVITAPRKGRSGAASLTVTAADAAGGANLSLETQEGDEATQRMLSINAYRESARGPHGSYARITRQAASTAELFDYSVDRGVGGRVTFVWNRDQRRLELALNGAYDRGASLSEIRPSSAELLERYRSRYVSRSAEISGAYATPVGSETSLETTVLHSEGRSDTDSEAETAGYRATSLYDSSTSESVVRTTLTHRPSKSLSVDVGAEAAFNRLDGRSSYVEDGLSVALPSQDVRVRERRGEAFARIKGPVSRAWRFDLGLAFEASELELKGTPSGQDRFYALKPDAALVFTPDRSSRVTLSLSRRVGQLDFSDFVTSVGLEERTLALGAPRLEPVRRWRLEGSYNRTFQKDGVFNLTLAREHVDNPQELTPIDGQDAPGNLGSAERRLATLALTLPLKEIGGLVLSTSLQYQDSKVRDPVTGEFRRLSGEARTKAEVRLRKDFPDLHLSWGADLQAGSKSTSYRLREVKTYAYDPYWGVEVEYKPDQDWSLRLRIQGGGDYVTRRSVYAARRGEAAPVFVERRAKRGATLGYLTIRRAI